MSFSSAILQMQTGIRGGRVSLNIRATIYYAGTTEHVDGKHGMIQFTLSGVNANKVNRSTVSSMPTLF